MLLHWPEQLGHIWLSVTSLGLLRGMKGSVGLASMAKDLTPQGKALAQEAQYRVSRCKRRDAWVHNISPHTVNNAAGKDRDCHPREVVINQPRPLCDNVGREVLALEQVPALKALRQLTVDTGVNMSDLSLV